MAGLSILLRFLLNTMRVCHWISSLRPDLKYSTDAHLQHRIKTQSVCQVKEILTLLANPLLQLGRGDGLPLVRFRVAGFQSAAGLHAHLALPHIADAHLNAVHQPGEVKYIILIPDADVGLQPVPGVIATDGSVVATGYLIIPATEMHPVLQAGPLPEMSAVLRLVLAQVQPGTDIEMLPEREEIYQHSGIIPMYLNPAIHAAPLFRTIIAQIRPAQPYPHPIRNLIPHTHPDSLRTTTHPHAITRNVPVGVFKHYRLRPHLTRPGHCTHRKHSNQQHTTKFPKRHAPQSNKPPRLSQT